MDQSNGNSGSVHEGRHALVGCLGCRKTLAPPVSLPAGAGCRVAGMPVADVPLPCRGSDEASVLADHA